MGDAIIHRGSAALAAPTKTHHDGNTITDVEELFRFESVVLPHCVELPCEVHQASLAPKRPGGNGREERHLEIRLDQVGASLAQPLVDRPKVSPALAEC